MHGVMLLLALSLAQGQGSPDINVALQRAIVAGLGKTTPLSAETKSTPVFIDSQSFLSAAAGAGINGVLADSLGKEVGTRASLRSSGAALSCEGGCHLVDEGTLVQAKSIRRTGDSLFVMIHVTWPYPLYIDGKPVSMGIEEGTVDVVLVRDAAGFSVRKANRMPQGK